MFIPVYSSKLYNITRLTLDENVLFQIWKDFITIMSFIQDGGFLNFWILLEDSWIIKKLPVYNTFPLCDTMSSKYNVHESIM